MPQLLLELFSEEIPARMQASAADDLRRLVTHALAEAGLFYEAARAFVTPRRLTLVVDGVPGATKDLREERKGPRADAPEKAIEGFLRSVGLTRDQIETRETDKGPVLFATIARNGRPTPEVVAGIVPDVVRGFPWPKSMRWADGSLRWVRPLHSILCLFDGETVPFEVDGVVSGNTTRGHRFLAPEAFTVKDFESYADGLERAKVALDAEARKALIVQDARKALFVEHLELLEDAGLLDEVAGLVEWPVPLVGRIDDAFVDLPPEVLTTTMRAHQRYFSVRDPKTGELAPRFVLVANIPGVEEGRAIVAGNERVLRARLSDARFFWDQDRRTRLEDRLPALEGVVFHAKLGSVRQKVERVEALAREIAPLVGADPNQAARAARLAKADLTSGMVGEFPELQGKMGRYYALHDGEVPAVADAIRDHYAPLGPSDQVPTAPVSIAVALADKIDTLVGFWAIDEKPTGSKDPFALRRAALGVIRIVLENEIRISSYPRLRGHATRLKNQLSALRNCEDPAISILKFLHDRMKVHLRESGVRHDVTSAAVGGDLLSADDPRAGQFMADHDDFVLLGHHARALQSFLATEDGANLLTAYRRASNILRIEEKKDGRSYAEAPDASSFQQDEERTLADQLAEAAAQADAAFAREDFAGAMAAMARLRSPVDAFFDKVTVNADDKDLRANRLRLLSQIRATLSRAADFSQIEG